MNIKSISAWAFAASLIASTALAGHRISPPQKEVLAEEPKRTLFPEGGSISAGALVSEDAVGIYADSITGLWAPQSRNAFLFLNSRHHYEDNGQFISSTGLGFRAMCPKNEIIAGLNVFWDSISSAHDNDFDQLGIGAEILTHWVDARFNYYLPEDDTYEIGRRSTRKTGGTTTTTRNLKSYEAALEGFNAEAGVLIPGLDKYAEVRVFAGYYHYDNPFGGDFQGFKARVEAHVLPGVIAGVEYWDDAELMGGHWTGSLSVSVPFSIYNLVTGRNPFEGIAQNFTPRQRAFKERMGDMIDRSHRIQTTTSGDLPAGVSTTENDLGAPLPPPTGGSAKKRRGGGFPVE